MKLIDPRVVLVFLNMAARQKCQVGLFLFLGSCLPTKIWSNGQKGVEQQTSYSSVQFKQIDLLLVQNSQNSPLHPFYQPLLASPFYTSSINVQEFQLSHIQPTVVVSVSNFKYSGRHEVLSHCSFNLYFSNNYYAILFFICLLPFCRMFF